MSIILPAYFGQQPPFNFAFQAQANNPTGEGYSASSFSGAWGAAIAAMGAYGTPSTPYPGGGPSGSFALGYLYGSWDYSNITGQNSWNSFYASAQGSQYSIFFYNLAGAPYFKMDWDEVTIDQVSGDIISTNSQEFTWGPGSTPVLGPDFKMFDPTTWQQTDLYAISPPEPPEPALPSPDPDVGNGAVYYQYNVFIQNFRFTCLESYDAPEDGSANGYPP